MGADGPTPLFDAGADGAVRRAPQPLGFYRLDAPIRAQLDALALAPDRPVLAVDADEVLVLFARHLQRFALSEGVRLDLSEYRLDGAFTRLSDGVVLSREDGWRVIGRFFDCEAGRQVAVDGAAEALRGLADAGAQILVLTNVPAPAAEARRANLAGHGIDYPMVVNSGGKGGALRYLWDRGGAPFAFIDDSPSQIRSAAQRAPEVSRIHFVADSDLRRLAGALDEADHQPEDWRAAAAAAAAALRL